MAPSPTGLPPHRQRAHGALQLAVRAARGRRVPPPHREHRHEPRGGRVDGADPGVAALARARLGRAGHLPARPPWSECASWRRRLVEEGKAYEDEGAIRFRMPDEGVTRVGRPRCWSASRLRTRSSRTSSSSAPTAGRPTTSPRRSRTGWDGITHVIRGNDHISNTPKQILLLQALGAADPPLRAVPIRARRRREQALETARRGDGRGVPGRGLRPRRAGQLPRAARVELRRPDDDHVARRELVERFTLERVGASPAIFDYEKLDWMNGEYLRAMSPEDYAEALVAYLREQGYDWDEDRIRAAMPLVQEKIERLGQFPGTPASCSSRSSQTRRSSTAVAPSCARRARTLRGDGAVRRRARRGSASGNGRAARAEAAGRVQADPGRRHGLEGLPGPVREHRAPRPRRDARAARRATPRRPRGLRARRRGSWRRRGRARRAQTGHSVAPPPR